MSLLKKWHNEKLKLKNQRLKTKPEDELYEPILCDATQQAMYRIRTIILLKHYILYIYSYRTLMKRIVRSSVG